MDIARDLISRYFGSTNGELTVEGIPISDIAKQYDTPFFVYSTSVFQKKLSLLQCALPDFHTYYAIKANPSPGVIDYFVQHNCGLDAATSAELYLALSCGCPSSRIFLSGAGKTNQELVDGFEKDVAEIYVESLDEIRQLSLIAERQKRNIRVSLRINPGEVVCDNKVYRNAAPAAYGLDEELIDPAVEEILRHSCLHLCGINAYWGTQHLDEKTFQQAYRHTLSLAEQLTRKFKISLNTINFGGGFGVPYYANEHEFALQEFGQAMRPLLEKARECAGIRDAKFAVEPGRYLVSDGGLYVTRVLNCKYSRGKHFIVVDGGIHHHLAATGNLGHVIKKDFPMVIANRLNEQPETVYTITGRQCTALDTLARNITLPVVQKGDILVIFQSGAYTRSVSPLEFRSHPEPMEIMLHDGNVKIIRRNTAQQDILRGTLFDKTSPLSEE